MTLFMLYQLGQGPVFASMLITNMNSVTVTDLQHEICTIQDNINLNYIFHALLIIITAIRFDKSAMLCVHSGY